MRADQKALIDLLGGRPIQDYVVVTSWRDVVCVVGPELALSYANYLDGFFVQREYSFGKRDISPSGESASTS